MYRANIKIKIIIAALTVLFFILTVSAKDNINDITDTTNADIEDVLGGMRDIIPESVSIPDELFDGMLSAEDITTATGIDYIFGRLKDMLKEAFFPAAGFLAVIMSTVLVSSVIGVISRDIGDGVMSASVSMITCLCLALYIITAEERLVGDISTFAHTVTTFTTAMVPMIAGLLAAAANTSTAAVTSSGLLLFSAAVEYAVTYIFIPIFRIGLSLAVISSVAGEETGVGGICEFIKKTFSWLAAGAATLFATVLSYQTAIAASADTAAARGLKYTFGSAVPVVGGALSDALRTATAGLSVIKNGAGTIGIVVLLLLTCPLIITIVYTMASLGIASLTAGMLGCKREASLLSEIRAMMGFAAAIVVLTAFVFIFALALFMSTAPAITS